MTERTFTAAEMLQEADELDLASVASEAAAMLRQGARLQSAWVTFTQWTLKHYDSVALREEIARREGEL